MLHSRFFRSHLSFKFGQLNHAQHLKSSCMILLSAKLPGPRRLLHLSHADSSRHSGQPGTTKLKLKQDHVPPNA
eukprot:6214141-Pleurochrysis_carterae.AAC.9